MPFVNESEIRAQSFLNKFEEIPSERLRKCLQLAHSEILEDTVLTDESTPTEDIKQAEVLLTLSHLFHGMAISSAIESGDIRISGIHVDNRTRPRTFQDLADELKTEAWAALHSYIDISKPLTLIVVKGRSL